MPLYALTDADEIAANYQQFAERLRDGATRYDGLGIGWQGENRTTDIYWQPTAQVWSFAVEETDRYWFGVGTDDPAPNNSVGDIVVQFGFVRAGSNRRFRAIFARDDQDGAVHLLHSGGIGGGRPGISKIPFLAVYDGPMAEVAWPNGATALYCALGPIEAADLMVRVAAFAQAVQTFKNSVTATAGAVSDE